MSNEQSTGQLVLKAVKAGLWTEIPVFRLVLGMCPMLAVTSAVKPAITMGLCVIFVLVFSNIAISVMRNLIKPHLRILMFTLAIATFVTIADLFVRAYSPKMSEVLGAYIPLIIVNCIIICRSEACASKNGIIVSTVDGLAMGVGFTIVLCILATVREILSSGTWLDMPVMPKAFVPWVAMKMPVGAFVTLGLMIGLMNALDKKKA